MNKKPLILTAIAISLVVAAGCPPEPPDGADYVTQEQLRQQMAGALANGSGRHRPRCDWVPKWGCGGSGGAEHPAAAVGIGIALGAVQGDSNFSAPDDFDGLLGPVPQG